MRKPPSLFKRMNFLANLMSLISLACGFISIIFSLESHFTMACWAIIISVVFDGLDGQVARKNPIPSDFGKEIDSLIDVVCFGVAPVILGAVFLCKDGSLLSLLVFFFYLASSVMRLAKYNITPKEKLSYAFEGLPTTVSGGMLASVILLYRKNTVIPGPGIFLVLVSVLAVLMVSKVKYINLEGLKKVFRDSFAWPFSILCVILLFVLSFYFFVGVFIPELAIFLLFVFYFVFSPLLLEKIV